MGGRVEGRKGWWPSDSTASFLPPSADALQHARSVAKLYSHLHKLLRVSGEHMWWWSEGEREERKRKEEGMKEGGMWQ